MRGPGGFIAAFAVAAGLFGSAICGPLNPAWAIGNPSQGNAGDTAGAVGWALAPANGPLGNNRANYTYMTAAGSVIEDAIVIESRSSAALRLKVYAADGYTTPDGLLDLKPAAEEPKDAGAWVSFDGASSVEIDLAPSTSVTVPLRWEIPTGAVPGDYAGGIVTSLVEEAGAATVQVDRRLALRAYLNLSGKLTPGLTVSDLRVKAQGGSPFASGRLRVAYTLTNSGNARLVPTEQIAVSGPFGLGGREGGEDQVLPELLPGSYLSREVTVAGVFPLFRTKTEVTVSGLAVGLGAEGVTAQASRESTIWTVPWLWLGLFVLAVAAAVAVGLRRRFDRGGAQNVT
jgi:hypothetical protein